MRTGKYDTNCKREFGENGEFCESGEYGEFVEKAENGDYGEFDENGEFCENGFSLYCLFFKYFLAWY